MNVQKERELRKTVKQKTEGRHVILVLDDGDTWEELGKQGTQAIVVLPEGKASSDVLELGGDAVDVIADCSEQFREDRVSGRFNLAQLILDLPWEILERYRVDLW